MKKIIIGMFLSLPFFLQAADINPINLQMQLSFVDLKGVNYTLDFNLADGYENLHKALVNKIGNKSFKVIFTTDNNSLGSRLNQDTFIMWKELQISKKTRCNNLNNKNYIIFIINQAVESLKLRIAEQIAQRDDLEAKKREAEEAVEKSGCIMS